MNARYLKLLALAVASILSIPARSHAGCVAPIVVVPLPGTKMQLSDTSGPAGRRNYAALRDGDQSVQVPDPTITGATASIGRVGAGEVTVLDLPASGWSGGTSVRRDFKFKSRSGAVVSARLLGGRSIRISARGDGVYPLGGTPQGGVGIIIDVGGVRFCGFFGGTIVKDDGERFVARTAPAPAGCPILGTTTTTTTSTSTTTTLACNPVECNDEDACTVETCEPGICIYTEVDCNDGNACTDDTCDSANGCINTGVDCNDDDACTEDTCDTAFGCMNTAIVCNDNDACTDDACDSLYGCIFTAVCNDGNACTDDTCDPASGCIFTKVDCNDGNACTVDSCAAASGCSHTVVGCDDGNFCTVDSCAAASGCSHTVVDCNDENACTVDSCAPAIGCINIEDCNACPPCD